MLSIAKIGLQMWPQPTPHDFDFNEIKSTLSEVVFTKVTGFFRQMVFRKKIFSPHVRMLKFAPPPPDVTQSCLWGT